jgi:hypothetical protein
MCSVFQYPGIYGLVVGILMVPALWWIIWIFLAPGPFSMDIRGEKGSLVPLLTMYVDIAKFVIGLASTSIALLVGSATFRTTGTAGPILSVFASPLFLLALSIVWGVCFMSFLTLDYEAYRHNEWPYTRFRYSRNQAFGFSSLICFALGYLWLIFIVKG